MSTPMRPSEPGLQRMLAALEEVPPVSLASYPWMQPGAAKHRRRRLRPYVVLVFTAGAAACAGAVVVSGVASGGASTGPTPTLSPAAREAFSVFDGTAAQASPAAVKVAKELTSRELDGVIDPASFRVAQSSPRFELVVFGNSSDICLVESEPGIAAGGGCGPQAIAAGAATLQCGTIEAPERNGGVLLDCLVPDGVSSISVSTGTRTVPLSITNNTVGAILDPKPSRVSWTTRDGTRREEQLIQ